MIILEHREHIVSVIAQTVTDGARVHRSCEEVGIDASTYRRWQTDGVVIADNRPMVAQPEPVNKLTQEERKMVLLTCQLPEFQSQPPSLGGPTRLCRRWPIEVTIWPRSRALPRAA